jgi:hypothetical protein
LIQQFEVWSSEIMLGSVARVWLSVIVCFVMAGCGGGGADTPDLGTVSGTVNLGGQPLAGAEVSFQSAGSRPSVGTTDEDGYYKLTYSRDTMGAVIGNHTVRIRTYLEEVEGDEEEPSEPEVPEKVPAIYNDDSGLTAKVEAGSNEHNFDLEEGEVLQPDEDDE